MRKFCLYLLSSLALISCNNYNESETKIIKNYKDYENYEICWNSLLFSAKTQYFVYIYNENCLHCDLIKQQIFDYIEEEEFPLFLIHFSDDIKIGNDVENTIGVTQLNEIFIKGTPSLIEIDNGTVVFNVAGPNNVLALLYSKKK